MRRFLFIVIVVSLLLVNVNVNVLAADEPLYEFEIVVYDISGNQLNLEHASYQIRTGESSYNHILTYNLKTGCYKDGTYKVTDKINSSVNGNVISVSCHTNDSFDVMISADLGSYHFHIEENIPLNKLQGGGIKTLEYRLSDLDTLMVNVSTDGTDDGNCNYYLYKDIGTDKGRREDSTSNGIIGKLEDKKFYVTEGVYELTISSVKNHKYYVYRENHINTSESDRIDLKPVYNDYRKYVLYDKGSIMKNITM